MCAMASRWNFFGGFIREENVYTRVFRCRATNETRRH